jgi:hypothetical protein
MIYLEETIMSSNYQQMHDQLSQEPSPDPNSFLKWLFTSGILTPHQLDLIRAKMTNPSLGPEAQPGTMAGTGAAIAAQGSTGGAAAPAAPVGPPAQPPAPKPVQTAPTGGSPAPTGKNPIKTGAVVGQL